MIVAHDLALQFQGPPLGRFRAHQIARIDQRAGQVVQGQRKIRAVRAQVPTIIFDLFSQQQ